MAAKSKRNAAIAAAVLAALLLCGCAADEPHYEDRAFAETLADGGIRALSLSPMIGYYMETTDGTPFFFSAEDSTEDAMVVGNLVARRAEISFEAFTPGDKIVVWWYIIEETYPSHIHIYDIELVKAGKKSDLPQAIQDEIASLSDQITFE